MRKDGSEKKRKKENVKYVERKEKEIYGSICRKETQNGGRKEMVRILAEMLVENDKKWIKTIQRKEVKKR